jgi:hypothetical protein
MLRKNGLKRFRGLLLRVTWKEVEHTYWHFEELEVKKNYCIDYLTMAAPNEIICRGHYMFLFFSSFQHGRRRYLSGRYMFLVFSDRSARKQAVKHIQQIVH